MRQSTCLLSARVVSVAVLLIGLGSYPSPAQELEQEVVVNLAAGHVAIYVAKDAMIVGGTSERVEPESRPPLIFPLGGRRMGVLLGAAEWLSPSGSLTPVRLDRELPSLSFETPGPHLRGAPDLDRSSQASDIEVIGVALLERLRTLAERLHHKVSLEPEEPLVELLIVNFQSGYGPEIWLLRYRISQELLRGDYWKTRVLRPSYTQLFPPEKGQPRTLVEVHYPTEGKKLLDLLRQNDPRLARVRNADPKIARAAERLVDGESQKSPPEDAANFLRAALDATANPETKVVLGVLNEQRGFEWILAPPEPPQKADPTKPREPGAPTLRKPPPP